MKEYLWEKSPVQFPNWQNLLRIFKRIHFWKQQENLPSFITKIIINRKKRGVQPVNTSPYPQSPKCSSLESIPQTLELDGELLEPENPSLNTPFTFIKENPEIVLEVVQIKLCECP